MINIKNKKAQSILEYIIVLTAIVWAILVFAAGPIKSAVTKAIDTDATRAVETAASKMGLLSP